MFRKFIRAAALASLTTALFATGAGASIGDAYGATDPKGDSQLAYADITATLLKNNSALTYKAHVSYVKNPWATTNLRKFLTPSLLIELGPSNGDGGLIYASLVANTDGSMTCYGFTRVSASAASAQDSACSPIATTNGVLITMTKDDTVAKSIDAPGQDAIEITTVTGSAWDYQKLTADIRS